LATTEKDVKLRSIYEDGASPGLKKTAENAKTTGKEIENTSVKTKNAIKQGSLFNKFMSTVSPLGFAKALQSATSKIVELTKKQADYIESLNLLDVAFDGDTKSIRKFTSAYSEILNLDEATLINSASHFKILAQSMGLAADEGERFSKVLTQLTLDVSSLYNMNFTDAQQALQNATMGRGTKLKTKTGVSVLESTVQTTLETLGVDAYIKNMNDTEKAIARVITIIYQLKSSQGDLARTIEAPANQFRVFGEQITQLARNIGSIFLPALSAILPYLNAILIVLNKIIRAIATFVGFREDMWDFFDSNSTLEESFDDLGSSIGGVGSAADSTAKKLQGLRAFDKLNNLTTPTPTSSGGVGGAGTGINPDLLEMFKKLTGEYNSMLDGIETKATKIAKRIMKELNSFDTSKAQAAFKKLLKAMEPVKKFTFDNLKNFYTEFLKPIASWTISNVIPRFLDSITSFVESVDWNRLTGGFKDLWAALSNFTMTINEPIIRLWEDVLVPLGSYIFNDSVYGIIDFLTGLANILGVIIRIDFEKLYAVGKAVKWLIENLGKVISPVLFGVNWNALGDAFKSFTDKIVKFFDFKPKDNSKLVQDTNEILGETQSIADKFSKDIAKLQMFPKHALSDEGKTEFLTDLLSFTDQIINTINSKKGEVVEAIQGLFEQGIITEEEKDKRLAEVDNFYNDITEKTNARRERITEIIKTAMERDGVLTAQELSEIYKYNYEFQVDLTNLTTTSSEEQVDILEKQKNREKLLTIEAASEMLKTAKKTKDDEIEAAKEKYEKIKENLDTLKEAHQISDQEYNEMLKTAKKTKKEEIDTAKNKYTETYNELVKNNKKVAEYISSDDGHILNGWEKFWSKFKKKNDKKLSNIESDVDTSLGNIENKVIKLESKFNTISPTINIKSSFDSTGVTKGVNNWLSKNRNVLTGIGAVGQYEYIKYAQGGLPSVGQMFIANERGPELVGQIGGQSFVANQNQMLDIIDKKLSNAGGLNNATFVIQVGNEEIARTVIRDLQSMAKSNGKPITIGG